jgi:putative flavoprotein involved in K+ transport
MPTTDTLVIGAGQAGLALSRHLTTAGHDHVVLDRGRIGERWRSERWDSLALLTPNWLNQLPGSPPHADPDGYMTSRAFVRYLERYAASFDAPLHERVEVLDVRRVAGRFAVSTTDGDWRARRVVIATGDAAIGALPAVEGAAPAGPRSLHASRYRRPSLLPDGAVLVVGAGPSGQQIAAELARSGRDVVLAVGAHMRVPRRYRGDDVFTWLQRSGNLDQTLAQVTDPAAARRGRSLPLTGTRGGEQLDLGVLRALGVVVSGRLTGFHGRRAVFAPDLHASVEDAEQRMRSLLQSFDDTAARLGLDVEDAAPIAPVSLPAGPSAVDLRGFGAIVWATGYRRAYPWLKVGAALDRAGEVMQLRGRTAAPGLHTLGMKFQWRRKSHIIGGVGFDAADLAAEITAA